MYEIKFNGFAFFFACNSLLIFLIVLRCTPLSHTYTVSPTLCLPSASVGPSGNVGFRTKDPVLREPLSPFLTEICIFKAIELGSSNSSFVLFSSVSDKLSV